MLPNPSGGTGQSARSSPVMEETIVTYWGRDRSIYQILRWVTPNESLFARLLSFPSSIVMSLEVSKKPDTKRWNFPFISISSMILRLLMFSQMLKKLLVLQGFNLKLLKIFFFAGDWLKSHQMGIETLKYRVGPVYQRPKRHYVNNYFKRLKAFRINACPRSSDVLLRSLCFTGTATKR